MSTAWYTPSSFSPIPVGRSSNEESKKDESDDNSDEEVEGEILKSVEYVCGLIDEEVNRGVDVKRIIVGGLAKVAQSVLSQDWHRGMKGRIAAVVGLSGYLPKGRRIKREREGYVDVAGEGYSKMKVFLAHGTKDMLVPLRVFRDAKARVAHTVGEEEMEAHEYQGMGHATSGPEFRDVCSFLEKMIPELEI